jgi:hypothetical protein
LLPNRRIRGDNQARAVLLEAGDAVTGDLSAWLATELGGRVTKTDLRTGALLRRTSKIVALQDGLSWECYINAASVWLWLNGSGTAGSALSINRRSPGMLLIEPVAHPFIHLTLPAFTRPGTTGAGEQCRQWEPFVEGLELGRFDYLTATPDQVTLWNRRPTADVLRRRIQLMRSQFRDG